MMVRLKDEDDEEVVRSIDGCAPIASDHEHQVSDLRDDGRGDYAPEIAAFAERVCAHVKLIAEAAKT